MRRTLLLLSTMVLALLLASGVALSQTAPSGTLDAHFTPDPNTLELGASFGGGVRVAQTFTAVNSGQLTDAQVVAEVFEGGELTMQITTVDSSGNPTDDVLASTTITNVTDEMGDQVVTGTFSNPPSVVSGTKYALVLSAPATQGGNWFGAVGEPPNGPYAGGESMFKWDTDTVWQSNSTQVDLAFAIYVETSSISDLKELVTSLALPAGTSASLQTKLDAALTAENGGDTGSACTELTAFINQVRAQAGKKKISAQDAEELITAAQRHQEVLGCS